MRQRLGQLALFVLLGAMATVAVAWSLALLVDGTPISQPPQEGFTALQQPCWSMRVWHQPGTTVAISSHGIPVPPRPPRPDASQAEIESWLDQQAAFAAGQPTPEPPAGAVVVRAPSWSRAATPPRPDQVASGLLEDARGWPLRSLMSYTPLDAPAQGAAPPLRETWRIEMGRQMPLGFPRGLPLMPIWPGFLLDTAIYAVALFLLIRVPRSVRRWSRARRGCCMHCGYNLRGLSADIRACPECGSAR